MQLVSEKWVCRGTGNRDKRVGTERSCGKLAMSSPREEGHLEPKPEKQVQEVL